MAASAYIFLPPKISALWFGEKERATAVSVLIAADSLGLALGYLQPPIMVKNSHSLDQIGQDLGVYLLAIAVQSVFTMVYICCAIRDKPNTPPSASEAGKDENRPIGANLANDNEENSSVIAEISRFAEYKNLLSNRSYLVIIHVHAILFSTESVWLVVLNEILIKRFPGYEVEIGTMGAFGLIASIFSNFLVGILLDRTRAFKKITLVTLGLSFLLAALFTVLFYFENNFISFYVVYIAITAVFTTYYTTSFDHSSEMTYPISETKSAVLLIWISQVYGFIFSLIAGYIILHFGSIVLVCVLAGLYLISFLVSIAVGNLGSRTNYNFDE